MEVMVEVKVEALEVKEGRRDKRASKREVKVEVLVLHLQVKVEVKVEVKLEGKVESKLQGGNLNHLLLMKIFQGMLTSFSYTWSCHPM